MYLYLLFIELNEIFYCRLCRESCSTLYTYIQLIISPLNNRLLLCIIYLLLRIKIYIINKRFLKKHKKTTKKQNKKNRSIFWCLFMHVCPINRGQITIMPNNTFTWSKNQKSHKNKITQNTQRVLFSHFSLAWLLQQLMLGIIPGQDPVSRTSLKQISFFTIVWTAFACSYLFWINSFWSFRSVFWLPICSDFNCSMVTAADRKVPLLLP